MAGIFIFPLSMPLSSFLFFHFVLSLHFQQIYFVKWFLLLSLGPYPLCFDPIFTIYLFTSFLSSSSLPSSISSAALHQPLLIIFVFLLFLRPTSSKFLQCSFPSSSFPCLRGGSTSAFYHIQRWMDVPLQDVPLLGLLSRYPLTRCSLTSWCCIDIPYHC